MNKSIISLAIELGSLLLALLSFIWGYAAFLALPLSILGLLLLFSIGEHKFSDTGLIALIVAIAAFVFSLIVFILFGINIIIVDLII